MMADIDTDTDTDTLFRVSSINDSIMADLNTDTWYFFVY